MVLALMGILVAITGPRIGSGIRGAQIKTSVRRFAAVMRSARTYAVTHRTVVVAATDLGSDTCRFRIQNTRPVQPADTGSGFRSQPIASSRGNTIPDVFAEPFVLEGDVRFIDFRFAQADVPFTYGAVMFLPQGNSTGGIFVLGPEDGPFYEVSIDPVTGRVHIETKE
ncbi:hypothetical protein JXA80_12560 [bacterium]|nr:hypothetical protein [candidate division CSSED10-310 bacterium]